MTRGVCKHREEVRFGKVERDDTMLDARRLDAFSANRPQQRLSPGDQSDINLDISRRIGASGRRI